MAAKRIVYRRRRQNRFSMFLVSLVVLMLICVVSVKRIDLEKKLEVYTVREQQLLQQKAEEEARTLEIEEYRKYTQTKKYVEEVAKDKLGLVYEGEILFKAE